MHNSISIFTLLAMTVDAVKEAARKSQKEGYWKQSDLYYAGWMKYRRRKLVRQPKQRQHKR